MQSKRVVPLSGARDKVGKIIIIWQYVCISLPATVSKPYTQPGNFAIKKKLSPLQELETKVAKLSLYGSVYVCVSADGSWGRGDLEMDI
jgi:hypothetical protein